MPTRAAAASVRMQQMLGGIRIACHAAEEGRLI
jgi:hypothetical protein